MIKSIIIFISDEKVVWKLVVFILSIFGIVLIISGPQISPDSIGYIEMQPIRSAGYPLFISAFKFFGDYYLWGVIIAQVILNLFAGFSLIKFIHKKFRLPIFSVLFILPLILYPIYLVSTSILTESIALPGFIFVLILFYNAIFNLNYRALMFSVLLNLILINIRAQFLFLYPVFFSALLYLFWKDKSIRRFVFYSSSLVILYFCGQLIDNTYHLIKHGKFTKTPFTGLQLASEAFYVTKGTDYKLFSDLETQMIVKNIYDTILFKNLNLVSFKANNPNGSPSDQIYQYYQDYNKICHLVIKAQLLDHYKYLKDINIWKAIDDKSLMISFRLIKANLKDFTINLLRDIQKRGFKDSYLMIAFFIILIVSFYGMLNENVIAKNMFFSGLMIISNFLLVALVEPISPRYSLYTDFLFIIVLISSLISLFQNSTPITNQVKDQSAVNLIKKHLRH